MKVFVLVTLFIGVFLLPVIAAKETNPALLLTFEAELFTEHVRQEGKPKPADGLAKSTVKLWLDSSGFAVARSTGHQLYDFKASRVIAWPMSGRGSTSVPLDAQIDFRRLEFHNRTRIAEALAQAGQKRPAFEPFAVETLLGVELKVGALANEITRTEKEGVIIFTVSGEEVVKVRIGEQTIPPAYRGSWVRFVRHRLRVHPVIRARLLALPHLPAKITCRWVNVGRRFRQTLLLTGVDEDPSGLPVPPPPANPGSDRLDRALAAAGNAVPPLRKGLRRRVANLERQGEWLGALLSLLEYSIATGERPSAEIRGLVKRATDPTQLAQLVSSLPDISDPERARELRDDLENLKDRKPRHGHLIDIWRANASVTIGEPGVARDLLIGALLDRPEFAGAWSDLGWIYHRSFKVDDAWRCFEAGLRVAPAHPMLASVLELRESLRRQYPQFYE